MRWRFFIPLLVLWASIATAANISKPIVSNSKNPGSSWFLPAHCESWSFSCLLGWLRPARHRAAQVSAMNSWLAPNDVPITVAPSWPAATTGVQPGVAASSWAILAFTAPVSKDCGSKPCPGRIPTRSVIRIELRMPEPKKPWMESGNQNSEPGVAISDRVWYAPFLNSYFPQRQGPALIACALFTAVSMCALLLYHAKAANVRRAAEAPVTVEQAEVHSANASDNQLKESFDRKVAELNASLESEIKTIEGLKSENANLENLLKVSKKKLEDNSNQLAETTKKFKDSSNKLVDTTTKLEATNEELKTAVNDLNVTNADLEAAKKRAVDGAVVQSQQATEIERLRGDLRTAKDDSQSKSSDIRSTRTGLKAEKALAELSRNIGNDHVDTSKLQEDLQKEQANSSRLREALSNEQAAYSKLHDHLRQKNAETSELQDEAYPSKMQEDLRKAQGDLSKVGDDLLKERSKSSKLQEDIQKEKIVTTQQRKQIQQVTSKMQHDKATHDTHVQAQNTTIERLRGEIDEADYKVDVQRRQFTSKIARLDREFSEYRELLKSTQAELLSIKEKGTKPRVALQDILGDIDLDPAAPMSSEIFEAGKKQILDLLVKQLDRLPYNSRYVFRRQRTTEAFERWLDETVSVSSLSIDQFRNVLKNALKFVDETQTLVDKDGWPWSKSIHPKIFSRWKDNAFPADNDSLADLQQKVRGDEVAPPEPWATTAASVPLPSQIVYPYGLQSLDTGLTVWTVVAEDYLRAFRGDRGRGKKNGQNEPTPSQAPARRADAPEGPNPSVAHLPAQPVSLLTDPAQTSAKPPIFGGSKGFNQPAVSSNNSKPTSSTPSSGTFNHASGLRRRDRKIEAHTGSKKADDTTVNAPTGPRAMQPPSAGPFTFGPNSGSFLFHNNGNASPAPAQSKPMSEKVVAPSSAGLDDSRWATAGPVGTQPRPFSSSQIRQSESIGQQSAVRGNPTLNDSKYAGPQPGTAFSEPSTARVSMPANSSWPPVAPAMAPAPPSSSQNVAANLERSYNTLPPPLAPYTRPDTRPSLRTSNVFGGTPPPSKFSPNAAIFNFTPAPTPSSAPSTATSAPPSVPPDRKIKKTRRTLRKPGTKNTSANGDDASSVTPGSEMFSAVSKASAAAPPAPKSSPPTRNARTMTPVALPVMSVGGKTPDNTTARRKPDDNTKDRAVEERGYSASMVRDAVEG